MYETTIQSKLNYFYTHENDKISKPIDTLQVDLHEKTTR